MKKINENERKYKKILKIFQIYAIIQMKRFHRDER